MGKKKQSYNELLTCIRDYNNKVSSEHKVQTLLFEKGLSVLDDNDVAWMKIPLYSLLSSVVKSIPEKLSNEAIRNFYEYVTDAIRKFYHYLSTVILTCDDSRKTSELILNEENSEIKNLLKVYTEYANCVSSLIVEATGSEEDKQHRDFFFSALDYKSDVYVEHITNYRDKNGDDNLSVIHIPPEKINNCAEVLRAITHEVANHVGQTADLRKTRSKLYAKCFFYFILYHYAIKKSDKAQTDLDETLLKCFKKMSCRLQRNLTEYLTVTEYKFSQDESDVISNDGSRVLYGSVDYTYYTSTSFCAVDKYFDGIAKDKNLELILKNDINTWFSEEEIEIILPALITNFELYSNSDSNSDYAGVLNDLKLSSVGNKEFLKDLSLNCIISTVCGVLYEFGKNTLSDEHGKIIKTSSIQNEIIDLFRECYADMFMLMITGHTKKDQTDAQTLAYIYFEKMLLEGNKVNESNSNKNLRFYVIYKYLCKAYNNGNKLELNDNFAEIMSFENKMDAFKKFHVECVVTYLENCAQIIENGLKSNEYFKKLRDIFQKMDFSDQADVTGVLNELSSLNKGIIEGQKLEFGL